MHSEFEHEFKKYHELSLKHKYTENSGMSNLIHVCKNLTNEQHLYSNWTNPKTMNNMLSFNTRNMTGES